MLSARTLMLSSRMCATHIFQGVCNRNEDGGGTGIGSEGARKLDRLGSWSSIKYILSARRLCGASFVSHQLATPRVAACGLLGQPCCPTSDSNESTGDTVGTPAEKEYHQDAMVSALWHRLFSYYLHRSSCDGSALIAAIPAIAGSEIHEK